MVLTHKWCVNNNDLAGSGHINVFIMTHLTDELLLKYALELLEGEEFSNVREHLSSCDQCRVALRKVEQEQKIFTSRYRLHLPTEDELKAEIRREMKKLRSA